MNSYQFTADCYKSLLKRSEQEKLTPQEIENLKQKLKVFKSLASFEEDDKFIAFDSGMFNEIFRGYIDYILHDLMADYKENDSAKAKALELVEKDIKNGSYYILEDYSAKEAQDVYMNGFKTQKNRDMAKCKSR